MMTSYPGNPPLSLRRLARIAVNSTFDGICSKGVLKVFVYSFLQRIYCNTFIHCLVNVCQQMLYVHMCHVVSIETTTRPV